MKAVPGILPTLLEMICFFSTPTIDVEPEIARHIFINAAGCCEVIPCYAVVGAAGRQSEVGEGRGAVRRWGCAFLSCEKFNGFGKALSEKLHEEVNGAAALALAVPVPFVSPDGQAVVPLPAVFISGAGKLLSL